MIRVRWTQFGTSRVSNGYGYAIALDRTREHLEKLVTFDEDAPLELQFACPLAFWPTPNKRNLLITMYESPDLAQNVIDKIRQADALIVPTEFSERIFRRVFAGPIYICPLGVEPVPFTPRSVVRPPVFRWLWLGAQNPRKGWSIIGEVWGKLFAARRDMELYVKTTTLVERAQGVRRMGNQIWDGRNLPWDELMQVYADAHGFVYPTSGEGWGSTLAEALRSGLPSVTIQYGGHLGFATKRMVRFVPHQMRRIEALPGYETTAPDSRYEMAVIDWIALARAMEGIMGDYRNALVMGRAASKAMAPFTWERSAQRLSEILAREARCV